MTQVHEFTNLKGTCTHRRTEISKKDQNMISLLIYLGNGVRDGEEVAVNA